jgi:superfamily I DNA/RNA helicase
MSMLNDDSVLNGAVGEGESGETGAAARTWSPMQEEVFRDVSGGAGHTVVRARAGSGKTTTILEALRHVGRGLTVLFVAFNKSIATELERRAPAGVEVRTMHAYGLRQCSRRWGKVRIDSNRAEGLVRAVVGYRPETAELRKMLVKAVSLSKGSLARTADDVDALCDAFGIDVEQDGLGSREEFVADVLRVLEWCKDPFIQAQPKSARQNEVWVTFRSNEAAIDFDDMVWLPVVNDVRCWQFDRVFVDETQDLNAAQIALALRACKPQGRILAVGDDKQGIYRFRGADSQALDNVVRELRARVLPLSITYRCAKSIVAVANTVVPDLEAAPGAPDGIVREVGEKEMIRDAREGDFILSRTNAPLVRLCLALLRDGRKANIQGKDIGVQLASFVRKSKCKTIEALRDYTEKWCEREVARMFKKDQATDTSAVEDRAATILVLAEQCSSVAELLGNIEKLFSDSDPTGKIILSTTHKAKGLEREKVWVLADTYMRRGRGDREPAQEEKNLWYVAVTRAKLELVLVRGVK